MSTQAKIAQFEQRLLLGKLHAPKQDQDSGRILGPICGRMLNNHSAQRAQLADRVEYAGSPEEFLYQLMNKKACRHCAVASGLLIRTRTVREFDCEETENEESGE